VYAEAKEKANQAVTKAKQVQQNNRATEAKVTESENAKETKNATEVPLYGVLGAAVLSLLEALLFAVTRKNPLN
ncbi:hypothetical protein, partial [Streptococcus pseudopneumoniae]|uniref:hypothetical protein n=1 Tax=Streptococcus pseudopneumoniae TaxID=257758 RepID=UPI00352C41D7